MKQYVIIRYKLIKNWDWEEINVQLPDCLHDDLDRINDYCSDFLEEMKGIYHSFYVKEILRSEKTEA